MKRYVYSLSPHGVRVSDILINIGSDIKDKDKDKDNLRVA